MEYHNFVLSHKDAYPTLIQKIIVPVLNSYACLWDTAAEVQFRDCAINRCVAVSTFSIQNENWLIWSGVTYISRNPRVNYLHSNFKTFQRSKPQKHASGWEQQDSPSMPECTKVSIIYIIIIILLVQATNWKKSVKSGKMYQKFYDFFECFVWVFFYSW